MPLRGLVAKTVSKLLVFCWIIASFIIIPFGSFLLGAYGDYLPFFFPVCFLLVSSL
jgi:hypothetical protein